MLDNSPAEAQAIQSSTMHTGKSWKQWTSRPAAKAVPGAVDFFAKGCSKGFSIFHISNRDTGDVPYNLNNLRHLNLPNAGTSHMYF